VHSLWHDLRQPHSAKHTPSPAAASKASTHAQQNSSTASGGALYTGAFVGMPRSAAYKGVVARVNANSAADPTAVMRRNIANPPFESADSTLPLISREAALEQFTEQFRRLWHLGNRRHRTISMQRRGSGGGSSWRNAQVLVPDTTFNPQFRIDPGGQLKL
jgi:hypothetical protein